MCRTIQRVKIIYNSCLVRIFGEVLPLLPLLGEGLGSTSEGWSCCCWCCCCWSCCCWCSPSCCCWSAGGGLWCSLEDWRALSDSSSPEFSSSVYTSQPKPSPCPVLNLNYQFHIAKEPTILLGWWSLLTVRLKYYCKGTIRSDLIGLRLDMPCDMFFMKFQKFLTVFKFLSRLIKTILFNPLILMRAACTCMCAFASPPRFDKPVFKKYGYQTFCLENSLGFSNRVLSTSCAALFHQIKMRQKIGRKVFRQADSKELGD